MLHFVALRAAKSAVNISHFALLGSPNCDKTQQIEANLHCLALVIAKNTINIIYFALFSSLNSPAFPPGPVGTESHVTPKPCALHAHSA